MDSAGNHRKRALSQNGDNTPPKRVNRDGSSFVLPIRLPPSPLKLYTSVVSSRSHLFSPRRSKGFPTCGVCNSKIKLTMEHKRCHVCRSHVHNDCQDKVSPLCIPYHKLEKAKFGDRNYSLEEVCSKITPSIPPVLIELISQFEANDYADPNFFTNLDITDEVEEWLNRIKKGKLPKGLQPSSKQMLNRVLYNYIRQLSTGVISKSAFKDFEDNIDPSMLKKAIQNLPTPNRCTLAFLMIHVNNILLYSEFNQHNAAFMADQLKFLLLNGKTDETMAIVSLPVEFWQEILKDAFEDKTSEKEDSNA